MAILSYNSPAATDIMLAKMESSPFHFHLTGSRYFGGATSMSDWDVFVEDSDDVKSWLDSQGFIKEGRSEYADSCLVCRYIYVPKPGPVIDVQVVNRLKVKLSAQLILKEMGSLQALIGKSPIEAKAEKTRIWDRAIAVAAKVLFMGGDHKE